MGGLVYAFYVLTLLGGILLLFLLWGIEGQIENVAGNLRKIAGQEQRIIWKSNTFDFKNIESCLVCRSDSDPLELPDIHGYECVAVIHTSEGGDGEPQIVETVYAKVRE